MSGPPDLGDSTDEPDEPSELKKGMRASPQGDPRVLFALNAVLSALFAYTVLWLSDFVGITTLTLGRVAGFALVLMVITHLLTR